MASLSRTNTLALITKRSLSKAATSQAYSAEPLKLNSVTLPNKLVVVSAENNSPVSSVALTVKAGSRYEAPENSGVSHVLRVAAGLKTKHMSSFAITRTLQEDAVSLIVTGDRETITYKLEGTADNVPGALRTLAEVVTAPLFRPWEVSDNIPRLKIELSQVTPQVRALDLLHAAAYRRGLGNSLFCRKNQLSKISSETLQHYVKNNMAGSKAAVVGVGIDNGLLKEFASKLNLNNDGPQPAPSKFYSGELRKEKGGQLATVAIATEGASLNNVQEALAFAVLQRALGIGPQVKWGNSPSQFYQAVAKAANSTPFAVSTLNVSYSDSGLFGFVLSAPATDAGKLTQAAVNAMKSASVDDKAVARGKKQLKLAVLSHEESATGLVEELAQQAVLLGGVQDLNSIAKAIDSISASDVNNALQKVSRGHISMASVGNLGSVPYKDEL